MFRVSARLANAPLWRFIFPISQNVHVIDREIARNTDLEPNRDTMYVYRTCPL